MCEENVDTWAYVELVNTYVQKPCDVCRQHGEIAIDDSHA